MTRRIANDDPRLFFRLPAGKPVSTRVHSYIRLIDTESCLVFILRKWGCTGYGAKCTKVIHRWPPKTVLRRVGIKK